MQDTWTVAHDLALVFVGLAYDADRELEDAEIMSINKAMARWADHFDLDSEDVSEVVVEAITLIIPPEEVSTEADRDIEALFRRSVQSIKRVLSREERQRAIEDVFSVAEADGMVLIKERNLIDTLAHAWEVKATRQRLMEETTASVEALPEWSLLHDIGLLYVVFAHSTDNKLSDEEIRAILERVHEWQPELSEEETRALLRSVIGVYADGIESEDLNRCMQAIREKMPIIQRLGIINDLIYIAEADGVFNEAEKDMVRTVTDALEVGTSASDA
ncbi:MAG: TerB family tellurite resistance protein [Bacteroidota bacterium]